MLLGMKPFLLIVLTLTLSTSLSACQRTPSPAEEPGMVIAPVPPATPPGQISVEPEPDADIAPQKDSETANLERCKAQLDALRTLAPEKYTRLNSAFRFIMRGASDYAAVRRNTNQGTQETIDALYKYRSNLICAQIDQTMMNSLSLHGALPQ